MVIDSSALIAILVNEPERARFVDLIATDATRLVSAAGLLETALVIYSRKGDTGYRELDLFVHRASLEPVPVDLDQVLIARRAFRRYGKGHHAAGLNFGDCFAYALAKATGEPLLFKGDDFRHTDIAPAARAPQR
ncbi:MAG TPA: type II toxin-antitoxin system VapC family toxin [Geminicoccaceae bacterium]|nr:type II toxin-antitoxin system VapC family toxin [Geminicoccaceae bacterium]